MPFRKIGSSQLGKRYRVRKVGLAAAMGALGGATRYIRQRAIAPTSSQRAVASAKAAISMARSATRVITRRKKQLPPDGDYNQISVARLQTGRKKRVTLGWLNKQMQAKNELTVYRWNGLKSFDDNGYYFIGKHFNALGNIINCPLYLYDLTGIINTTSSGVQNAICLKRMTLTTPTGLVGWTDQLHLLSDGSSTSAGIALESASTASSVVNYPHQTSILKWHDVKMNLWGAKARAVKYVIQVIKIDDEILDPWTVKAAAAGGTADDNKYQAFWQSMVKPYAYNPIAYVDPKMKQKYKVLKTYSCIIQPTSTTESDADPHVKTLNWFMRWDRIIDYSQDSARFTGVNDVVNEADFLNEEAKYGATTTDTKSKLFLLIRAQSTFQSETVDNTNMPSFDLMVRAAHVAQ